MDDPDFLTLDEVIEILQDQIARYGGDPGIRDLGLLSSAIAQPAASFGGSYLHAGLVATAAAYLFHIVQNHPFVDGNMRVGAATCDVFLTINGLELPASCEDDLVELVLATACGERTVDEIAAALEGMLNR